MSFVAVKTLVQCDLQALHRVRSRYVRLRIDVLNPIRGLLLERGIVMAQRTAPLRKALRTILADRPPRILGPDSFSGIERNFDVGRGRADIARRGEVRAVVGEHGVDLVGHGRDQMPRKFSATQRVAFSYARRRRTWRRDQATNRRSRAAGRFGLDTEPCAAKSIMSTKASICTRRIVPANVIVDAHWQ